MSLVEDLIKAIFVPKRQIGPFTATITIDEVLTDELEITQHPVQQGAAITDHAYMKPATVELKVWFGEFLTPPTEIYTKFQQLQASREPFDVVTGKRAYRNMLIKSLTQTNDGATDNILSLRLRLQEVLITTVEVASVPERKKQRKPGKTGKTENAGQKKAIPEVKKKSALRALVG